jgi:hypothetical protein
MNYELNQPQRYDNGLLLAIGAILLAFLLPFLTSCTTTRTVTIPEYHTEYITRTDTLHKIDSIYKRDSVSVYIRGDTVHKDKYVYLDKYKYIYKASTDTLIKTDSISVPYPVERQLTKWEQAQMSVGKWAIYALSGIILLTIIYIAVWWYRRKI